jgi:hypothetical protein
MTTDHASGPLPGVRFRILTGQAFGAKVAGRYHLEVDMYWIKRLSADETQDAQRLSRTHTAQELLELSMRYGRWDDAFRHYLVPLSAFLPYTVLVLQAVGVRFAENMLGFWVIALMCGTLGTVVIAREVWFQWCVAELAYRLRSARDLAEEESGPGGRPRRNIKDSQYSIDE